MIRSALDNESSKIARIHLDSLTDGFLTSLGQEFLNYLYKFLVKNELVWVCKENEEIVGFVSFSHNSSGIMSRFITSHPRCIFTLAKKLLIHPSLITRFLETYSAPMKSKNLRKNTKLSMSSCGELLSIAVSPNYQTSGMGHQLLKALEEYLIQNKITRYKVVAGAKLVGANRFYLKNGFKLADQIRIHGSELSNVYIKNLVL